MFQILHSADHRTKWSNFNDPILCNIRYLAYPVLVARNKNFRANWVLFQLAVFLLLVPLMLKVLRNRIQTHPGHISRAYHCNP